MIKNTILITSFIVLAVTGNIFAGNKKECSKQVMIALKPLLIQKQVVKSKLQSAKSKALRENKEYMKLKKEQKIKMKEADGVATIELKDLSEKIKSEKKKVKGSANLKQLEKELEDIEASIVTAKADVKKNEASCKE